MRTITSPVAFLTTLLVALATAGPAAATPPGIPSAATAGRELARLTVAARTHTTTYRRHLFPTWDTISGTCNTREYVLRRDGSGVAVDRSCRATSGTWYSPYDGATWYAAADLDIDHVVPLKNAWVSGAWAWTTRRRESFANDVSHPQLIAVTDNVNEDKSDSSPDAWRPPLASYHCTYARMWIASKYAWTLTVTPAEKRALAAMLATC
jgi:hypothetical protein